MSLERMMIASQKSKQCVHDQESTVTLGAQSLSPVSNNRYRQMSNVTSLNRRKLKYNMQSMDMHCNESKEYFVEEET